MTVVLNNKQEGIATITLNRPQKRNAIDGEMIEYLLENLRMLSEDKAIKVVILNGAGEHFCAGADIAWMQQIASLSHDENYEDAQLLADLMYQLHIFPKPTIALAQGAIMGGGIGLIAACDMAIAADNAFFAFSEVTIGIAPSIISPYVLSVIGERNARYYFLTGKRFNAHEALQMQLVNQVTAANQLQSVGFDLATLIKRNSPHALHATKTLINYVVQEKVNEMLSQKTAEHLTNLRTSSEAREGLQAFLEKRAPKWSD